MHLQMYFFAHFFDRLSIPVKHVARVVLNNVRPCSTDRRSNFFDRLSIPVKHVSRVVLINVRPYSTDRQSNYMAGRKAHDSHVETSGFPASFLLACGEGA